MAPALRYAIAARLLAGLVLAIAAAFLLPLAGDDALRSTLVVLPAAAGALAAIGRWAEAHGGRRSYARAGAVELGTLALLVALALGRSSLGLRYDQLAAPLLFAGLCLLLGWRVARLLLALRPCLGDELPRRPPWVFLLLPLTVYLAVLPWSTEQRPPDGDEPHYLLITHSLAYDFDARLSNNYEQGDSLAFVDRRLGPQPGDPVGPDGEAHSRHNLALPLVLAPAYRLGGKLGALTVMALISAALCRETLRLARRYSPESPGTALAAWSVLAFTSPLLLFSHQVWIEVPAALLAVIALERIHRLRQAGSMAWTDWLVLAVALMVLPLFKFRLVVVGGGLALLLLVVGWHRRRRLVLTAFVAFGVVAAAVLLLNQILFGNPLRYYRLNAVLDLYQTSPTVYIRGLVGLLFDAAFGLLAYAPIWGLLLAAVPRWRLKPRMLFDLGLVFLPYLIIFGPRGEWFGGWSPPFRYGVAALPALALLLEPALAGRRRLGARLTFGLLGGLTAVLTLVWLALPGWTYNLADGRSFLLDFFTGLVGSDAGRLFPSYVRLRPAAWIWPLAGLLLIALWQLGRRAPSRTARRGAAILLACFALAPLAAERIPTRTIEFEDPYVGKSAGSLYPQRWMYGRIRFRGGWQAPAPARLEAAVVPAGTSLSLAFDVQRVGPGAVTPILAVREGNELRARARLGGSPGWTELEMGPFPWSGGRTLTVEVLPGGERSPGAPSGVILDRARLRWHTGP